MAILRLPKADVPIEAFGFDVDGVLRDTGYLAFLNCRSAIEELGGTPPAFDDFVHDWCGKLTDYYRRCGVKRSDKEIEAVNARYLAVHDTKAPFEDVAQTLEHLESLGVRMFALSGHETKKLHAWFEQHGLHVRFVHVQGDGRDKTEHLSVLCRRIGANPKSSCYAGDWGQDMRAAKSAGLLPIGVARERSTHKALRRNGALHVVDHLHELTAIIR